MPNQRLQTARPSRPSLLRMGVQVFCQQVKSGHWVEQLGGLRRAMFDGLAQGDSAVAGYVVHPCLVSQQPTLVHAADLAARDPRFLSQLQLFAQQRGYTLLADRRSQDVAVASDRRKHWLPVIVLSVGLGSMSAAADQSTTRGDSSAAQTLGLFETSMAADSQPESDIAHAATSSVRPTSVQTALTAGDNPSEADSLASDANELVSSQRAMLAAELKGILLRHYQPGELEPEYFSQDLELMAEYYALYPEAVRLLRALRNHAWQLDYAKDTFETVVTGSQIQVKSVKVRFDSRAAAQLRRHKACASKLGACVASPADALLHELLHAESALLHSGEFIAQGGLNSVLYPFEHENTVIRKENALYKAMSAQDGSYRPSRHAHSGRVVASACVTCLN